MQTRMAVSDCVRLCVCLCMYLNLSMLACMCVCMHEKADCRRDTNLGMSGVGYNWKTQSCENPIYYKLP